MPGRLSAVVTWDDPIAYDDKGDQINVYCFPHSGYDFRVGTSKVMCGGMGNEGADIVFCSFSIKVTGKCSTQRHYHVSVRLRGIL